jgi:hypothetical protein
VSVDVSPVRDLIQLDGGDVEVLSNDASSVHLKLILTDAECAECVMPKGVLEEVASKLLGVTVRIDDPREV